jgi:hypothetical protein
MEHEESEKLHSQYKRTAEEKEKLMDVENDPTTWEYTLKEHLRSFR